MADTSTEQLPPCYGLYWEAIPGTDACMGCAKADGCLHQFASKRIPMVREQVGNDLQALSAATEVKPEAILIALDTEKRLTQPPARTPVPEAPAEGPDPAGNGGDISKAFDAGDPVEPAPEEPPIPQAAPEATEPPAPEPEPEEEKVTKGKKKAPVKKKASTKKKASKKKTSKKKTAAKKKPPKKKAEVQNPRKAGAAQRATAPASQKRTAKRPPAKTAKAQASAQRKRQRPPKNETPAEKSLRRWLREREKNPALAVATPGTILRGMHKGNPWEVKVLRGRYVYQNQEYPTLQATCNAITGLVAYPKQMTEAGSEKSRPKGKRKMSNWSAKRFFARALADLAGR